MALSESLLQSSTRTADRYAAKVRWLAAVYIALNAVSLAAILLVCWRIRLLVTLAQRSNVETLILAIIIVLAAYYLVSSWRGFVGGLRMAAYSLPRAWGTDSVTIERRKQRALPDGEQELSVCFDKTLKRSGPTRASIVWDVADEAGSLGRLIVDGAVVRFEPAKRGINNSLFEFLAAQINRILRLREPPSRIVIAFWGNIDEESSAVYRSAVAAIDSLALGLGAAYGWPSIELSEAEIEAVGSSLRGVAPALRNEALLPDLEYEVEYSVPILPEPLSFLQLKRHERRADPVVTMGYAVLTMAFILAVTILAVTHPPWVPSK